MFVVYWIFIRLSKWQEHKECVCWHFFFHFRILYTLQLSVRDMECSRLDTGRMLNILAVFMRRIIIIHNNSIEKINHLFYNITWHYYCVLCVATFDTKINMNSMASCRHANEHTTQHNTKETRHKILIVKITHSRLLGLFGYQFSVNSEHQHTIPFKSIYFADIDFCFCYRATQ